MAQHLLLVLSVLFLAVIASEGVIASDIDDVTQDINALKNGQGTTAIVPFNGFGHEMAMASKDNGLFDVLKIAKRAPVGFTGMRGKKDDELMNSNSNNGIDWDTIDPLERQKMDTNWDVDNPYGLRYKKAPTAFYGVRGKKVTGGLGNHNNYNRLNILMQNLEEDQIRKALLQDFLNRLSEANEDNNEIEKRAPIGFTGMRGKRPLNNDDDDANDNEMIGGVLAKRAPANAFMGVRGKKDVSHQNFKRSPIESYDSRGKKQRFVDFSNKFVAVRGKKDPHLIANGNDNDNKNGMDAEVGSSDGVEYEARGVGRMMQSDIIGSGPNANGPYETRYLVNVLPAALVYDSWNGKRNPSGFIGMRGKRSVNND